MMLAMMMIMVMMMTTMFPAKSDCRGLGSEIILLKVSRIKSQKFTFHENKVKIT